jgi:hypothetical protein
MKFQVTLLAARDADDEAAIRGLRRMLKYALRACHLRCISAREILDRASPDEAGE